MKGKKRCKILKEIRKQIAQNNDIEFITSECKHQGDCLGTCPKCEAEVRYLERELEKRQKLGRTIAVAGLAVALTTSTVGCDELFFGEKVTGGAPLTREEEQLGGAPMDLVAEQIYALQGVPSQQELPSLLLSEYYVRTLLSQLVFLEVTQEDIFAEWGDARVRFMPEQHSEIYELTIGETEKLVMITLFYGAEDNRLLKYELIEEEEGKIPDLYTVVRRGEEWARNLLCAGKSLEDIPDEWWNYSAHLDDGHTVFVYTEDGFDMSIHVHYDKRSIITDVDFGEAIVPGLREIAQKGEDWAREQLVGCPYDTDVFMDMWKYIGVNVSYSSAGLLLEWVDEGQEKLLLLVEDENQKIADVLLGDAHVSNVTKLLEKGKEPALDALTKSNIPRDLLRKIGFAKYIKQSAEDCDVYQAMDWMTGKVRAEFRVFFDQEGKIVDLAIDPTETGGIE